MTQPSCPTSPPPALPEAAASLFGAHALAAALKAQSGGASDAGSMAAAAVGALGGFAAHDVASLALKAKAAAGIDAQSLTALASESVQQLGAQGLLASFGQAAGAVTEVDTQQLSSQLTSSVADVALTAQSALQAEAESLATAAVSSVIDLGSQAMSSIVSAVSEAGALSQDLPNATPLIEPLDSLPLSVPPGQQRDMMMTESQKALSHAGSTSSLPSFGAEQGAHLGLPDQERALIEYLSSGPTASLPPPPSALRRTRSIDGITILEEPKPEVAVTEESGLEDRGLLILARRLAQDLLNGKVESANSEILKIPQEQQVILHAEIQKNFDIFYQKGSTHSDVITNSACRQSLSQSHYASAAPHWQPEQANPSPYASAAPHWQAEQANPSPYASAAPHWQPEHANPSIYASAAPHWSSAPASAAYRQIEQPSAEEAGIVNGVISAADRFKQSAYRHQPVASSQPNRGPSGQPRLCSIHSDVKQYEGTALHRIECKSCREFCESNQFVRELCDQCSYKEQRCMICGGETFNTKKKSASNQEFRHGEIFFEATGRVCRYLIAPDDCDDPLEILSKACKHWQLHPPSLLVKTLSARDWEGAYDSMDQKSQQDWHAKAAGCSIALTRRAESKSADGEAAPRMRTAAPKQKESPGKQLFKQRIKELLASVCRTIVESDGWLIAYQASLVGGHNAPGPCVQAAELFHETMPDLSSKLHFVTLASTESFTFSMPSDRLRANPSASDNLRLPSVLDQILAQSCTLQSQVTEQLIYKAPDAWRQDQRLNPQMTHLILAKDNTARQLQNIMEATFAMAEILITGKDEYSPEFALRKAQRGATIVVMDRTGLYADSLATALKARVEEDKARQKVLAVTDAFAVDIQPKKLIRKSATMKASSPSPQDVEPSDEQAVFSLPDSLDLSRFIIIDGLNDPVEKVIDLVSKRLGALGNENRREFGFAADDSRRIQLAWGLLLQYKFNMKRYFRLARFLHYFITAVALATTVVAVVSTAVVELAPSMTEGNDPFLNNKGFFPVELDTRKILAYACTGLPLLSSCLFSVSSRMNPAGKFRALLKAYKAVESEIYRYRTRTGDYNVTEQSSFVQNLQDAGSRTAGKRPANETAKPPTPARQLFMEQLEHIQQELLTGDMAGGALLPHRATDVDDLHKSLYSEARPGSSAVAVKVFPDDSGMGSVAVRDLEIDGPQFPVPGNNISMFHVTDPVADDGITVILAEEYVKFRIKPALAWFREQAAFLSKWIARAQWFLYLCVLAATVLPPLGLKIWVPVPLAVASACESLLKFECWEARLAVANNSSLQLQKLLLMWKSFSRTQRRQPGVRNTIVEVVETAALAEVTAWASVITSRKVTGGEEDDSKKK